MTVRRLAPTDAEQFQALRLRGLRECPTAFASSFEEEVDTPLAHFAERLAPRRDGALFGWFDGSVLRGVVGVQREGMAKLAHRAIIWGMYVAPEARRSGVGRHLAVHALEYAARDLGVRQVHLGVTTDNEAALTLYRSVGFAVYGTEPGYLSIDGDLHDEHLMVHVIESADSTRESLGDRSGYTEDASLDVRRGAVVRGDVIGGPIRWRMHLSVPPERVFAALDTDDGRAAFWAESKESDGFVEFRFRDGGVDRSRIMEREAPRLLTLEYLGGPVRFDLTADGEGGTELLLTHEGVRADEWIETHAGWLNVLFPLKAYVVHGVDLRNHAAGRSWDQGYVDG